MNNLTNLKYKGLVNVKLKINDKVINITNHNSGLPYLQKAFCKFITGYYEGTIDIPQYIDLRRSEDSITWISFLSRKIRITAEYPYYDSDLENWVATFTANIDYSALADDIPEGDTALYRLYLHSDIADDGKPEHINENDFAYIEVEANALARIVPGTQALIEWKMQLLVD